MTTESAATKASATDSAAMQPRWDLHPIGAGVSSALLLYCTYYPVGWWWLSALALVPLFLLVRSDRSRRSLYFGAWVGGLVFWILAVNWVRVSDPDAWPGWLAMALVLSFWWPAFLLVARTAVKSLGWPLFVVGPMAWIALEYVRAYYPFNGFQWFYLAHSLYGVPVLIQVSDLAGAWGLSLMIVAVNAWIVNLLTTSKGPRPTRSQLIQGGIVVLALVGTIAYGAFRLNTADYRDGPRMALLQSDVLQVFNRPRNEQEIVDQFGRLCVQVLEAEEPPDLIVWPETMFPHSWAEIDPKLSISDLDRQARKIWSDTDSTYWIDRQESVAGMLHRWTDRMNVPMLVGINTYHFRPGGPTRYNTAMLLRPSTKETQMYHKIHLVPFGEYVPLVETFPWLLVVTPFDEENIPSLDHAEDPSWLDLNPWRFATVICFEDSVPQVARRFFAETERRPDVLLNISNDGWFRETAAHELHLSNSVFRAVELRVPVARAVNTGTSALIDSCGRVLERLEPATEGVLNLLVPLDDRSSLYVAFGDWLPMGCLIGSFGLVPLAWVWTSRRSKPQTTIQDPSSIPHS